MYNFEPYNVLLAVATNIAVLLMTGFVLQGHICLLLHQGLTGLTSSSLFNTKR